MTPYIEVRKKRQGEKPLQIYPLLPSLQRLPGNRRNAFRYLTRPLHPAHQESATSPAGVQVQESLDMPRVTGPGIPGPFDLDRDIFLLEE